MYLAKLIKQSSPTYVIRDSYQRDDGTFGYRQIFDLGEQPDRYFELYNDVTIVFHQDLLDTVTEVAGKSTEKKLEQLLWDFLPFECRQRLNLFHTRSDIRFGPLTAQDQLAIAREIHIFDRRRLYYLRYGAVDQSRLSRLHEKCCRPLLGQSRDEREYYFRKEEQVLEPGMFLQYIFAIFNLQKHFTQSFAAWLPEALALKEIEEHFLRAICRLQRDERFWQGKPDSNFLHPHLARYLIMLFDFNAAPRSLFDDFARSFMAGHRKFRWPENSPSASPEKIRSIFGVDHAKLKEMSKDDLSKLYRQKAMALHPDKGGDHDLFVELSTVYNDLLKYKK